MDNISEFFKDIKDRLASPFFSSFIIAWLLINYRIVIILFFYKIDQVCMDGYTSYLDAVEKNNSTSKSLILPLAGALLYTFAYPIFKNIIMASAAWSRRWGTNWTLEIFKTGNIPVIKFIKLRDHYAELIASFEKIVKSESQIQDENLEFKKKVLELTHQTTTLNAAIDKAKEDYNIVKTKESALINELTGWKTAGDKASFIGKWRLYRGESTFHRSTKSTTYTEYGLEITENELIVSDGIKEDTKLGFLAVATNVKEFVFRIQYPDPLHEGFVYWVFQNNQSKLKFDGLDEKGKDIIIEKVLQ